MTKLASVLTAVVLVATGAAALSAGAAGPPSQGGLSQVGDKLTGAGEIGAGIFGYSVALSTDGKTALVGGMADDGQKGAAWIYTRSAAGGWVQQGGKLTAIGGVGVGHFGISVALSGDGNIALVGAPSDDSGKGAVWSFTRTGGAWSQSGGKLTVPDATGNSNFGYSVVLSSDGNTAAIGGIYDDADKGAVWIFTRSASGWTQQGAKLTGAGEVGSGKFGMKAALSSDGNIAMIGGSSDDGDKGAVWVFARSAGVWSPEGGKLTGGGEIGRAQFGRNVALSANGSTAVIGGAWDDNKRGAAWIFTRAGGVWSQQGGKLSGTDQVGNGLFGYSVALSSDGSTALIGGLSDNYSQGAAWLFTRSGVAWSQQGAKLVGVGETAYGNFGWSVALAGDGGTALVGAYRDSDSKGAVWTFSRVPLEQAGPMVMQIVSANVIGTGSQRELVVKLRIPGPATVQLRRLVNLRLLMNGVTKFQKAFPINSNGGLSTRLHTHLAAKLKKGTYQVRITVTARNAPTTISKSTVRVR